jgi:hypothetical protein
LELKLKCREGNGGGVVGWAPDLKRFINRSVQLWEKYLLIKKELRMNVL